MSQPSAVTTKVLVTFFHGIAIGSTLFRLTSRFLSKRLWWDDAWASVAMVFSVLLLVPTWAVSYSTGNNHERVIVFWVELVSYICELWAARMSLVIALVRFTPPALRLRLLAIGTAVLFSAAWTALLVHGVWTCAGYDTTWQASSEDCRMQDSALIAQVCADFVSDVLLIGIPLRLLWRARMIKHQRTLLLLIFSASIFTTFASIARAIVILDDTVSGLSQGIAANTEAAVSLIVCNLLVIGTCIYRTFRGGEDIESSLDYSGIVEQGLARARTK